MFASVNGKDIDVQTLKELRALIKEARSDQFGELALFVGELPIHSFFVLFNGKHAWPVYTYKIDRKSFSIRDSDVDDESEIEFRFSNGQVDPVPRSQTVSAARAARAIEHFFKTCELDPDLNWHRDF